MTGTAGYEPDSLAKSSPVTISGTGIMLVDGAGDLKACVRLTNEMSANTDIKLPIGTAEDPEAILTNTDTSVSFICQDVSDGTYGVKIITYPDGGSTPIEISYAPGLTYG